MAQGTFSHVEAHKISLLYRLPKLHTKAFCARLPQTLVHVTRLNYQTYVLSSCLTVIKTWKPVEFYDRVYGQRKAKKMSLSMRKMCVFTSFCTRATQLAFYVNLHRAVIGPSATLTGRWRPDIDLRRMLTGKDSSGHLLPIETFCCIQWYCFNSGQRRPWSDCTDAKTILSLRCQYASEATFSHDEEKVSPGQ